MYMLAISKFDIPGEYGFPLNSVYAKPTSTQEAGMWLLFICFYLSLIEDYCFNGYFKIDDFMIPDLMRQYLQQLRHETGARVCEKVICLFMLRLVGLSKTQIVDMAQTQKAAQLKWVWARNTGQ